MTTTIFAVSGLEVEVWRLLMWVIAFLVGLFLSTFRK